MCELVVPRESHLQGDTEGLNSHDRNGSGGGADGQVYQRVLAAVLWGNLVDHDGAESGDKCAIEEEA